MLFLSVKKYARLAGFFYLAVLCAAGPVYPAAWEEKKQDPIQGEENTQWVNIEKLRLEGIGWDQRQHPFDRLPAKAKGKVTDAVWNLSQNSAGINVRFRTNAKNIKVKWYLRFNKDLNHMAPTGVKGLDLYVKEGPDWRWAAVGRPTKVANESTLLAKLPGTEKEYMLYLPLYDGVDSVSVGVEPGATLHPAASREKKPIFFYGTSILQGACASRPGMAYPAIIGRSLNQETVNLGFSGNGKLDVAIAELLAETDAAMYVLDCLPNLQPEEVLTKTTAFVKVLRAAKPRTPILLVENIHYADEWINPELAAKIQAKNSHYRQAYEALKKAGIKDLHYLNNKNLTPADEEGTVDGVHLTDYGFMQLAGEIEKKIKKIAQ
jgi:hypothetical protein